MEHEFKDWLEKQRGRGGRVGDFADEALKDSNFPARGGWNTYFMYCAMKSPAYTLRALTEAWVEFTGKNPRDGDLRDIDRWARMQKVTAEDMAKAIYEAGFRFMNEGGSSWEKAASVTQESTIKGAAKVLGWLAKITQV